MRKFADVSESSEKLFERKGVICIINDRTNICLYRRLGVYQVLSGEGLIKSIKNNPSVTIKEKGDAIIWM